MKNSIIKLISFTVLGLYGISKSANAQVTPATSGVVFACDGGSIDLGAPTSGTTWEVAYDATDTATPSGSVTVDANNKINGTDVKTGYYYIMSKNTTTNCISDAQKLPVYALAPIVLSVDADDYCAPQASGATFTSSITSKDTEADATNNIVYQWYSLDGSDNETKITTNGTNSSFVPASFTTAGTQKFRLKTAYTFGSKIYCPAQFDVTVTIHTAPVTPTITIDESVSGI